MLNILFYLVCLIGSVVIFGHDGFSDTEIFLLFSMFGTLNAIQWQRMNIQNRINRLFIEWLKEIS